MEKSSGNSGRKFIVSGNERRKVFHFPYIADEWADIASDIQVNAMISVNADG